MKFRQRNLDICLTHLRSEEERRISILNNKNAFFDDNGVPIGSWIWDCKEFNEDDYFCPNATDHVISTQDNVGFQKVDPTVFTKDHLLVFKKVIFK